MLSLVRFLKSEAGMVIDRHARLCGEVEPGGDRQHGRERGKIVGLRRNPRRERGAGITNISVSKNGSGATARAGGRSRPLRSLLCHFEPLLREPVAIELPPGIAATRNFEAGAGDGHFFFKKRVEPPVNLARAP